PAGGLLGWAIATPLVKGLSALGAYAVFVALFLLGLLIVTKTPFSAIVEAVRRDPHIGADDEATSEPAAATTKVTRPLADDEPTRRAVLQLQDVDADQPPLPAPVGQSSAAHVPDEAATDGLTDADREAGRVPDPPVPAGFERRTPDGTLKARKIQPVESWDDYELPPVELLSQGRKVGQQAQRHLDASAQALQATLDEFGIDAKVARYSRGPTVTRFEIELGPGVQVRKVANLGDDIAYALAAPDVRIVAPIPGKSAIGVEVPNRDRDLITLRDILESDTARADDHPMLVSLGVDIAGNAAMVNLTTMPHLLVSGATGAGKSITLNAMIASIVTRARPDQVRMILIDPKRVELNHYEGAPHLLTPVVVDPRRAADALEWTVKEMEMRYNTLARLGYRDIDGYNNAVAAGRIQVPGGGVGDDAEADAYGHMPYILLVIDELSDLMMVAPRDVEDAICRIAQMARAVGIHMVIATQRPSVDVITGLIKANIPSRLALAVASQTDSRTILDMSGAEKLVGKGDMLFLPANQGKPSRLQGCFIAETEIRAVVEYAKRQRDADFIDGVVKQGKQADEVDSSRGGDDDSDEALTRRAAFLVVESGLGSTSMLQRKLRIGFARAGRVMDDLEELGVVGPNEGSKAREVLWAPEMVEQAVTTGLL
ncbi:MAG TPA: DNA translocase FtsK, partial [Nitriliruptorales bacterium]